MNIKKILLIILLMITMLGLSEAQAQLKTKTSYLGPSIGLSFLGSTPQFGFNYEYTMKIKDLDIDMDGIIGIGGIFRYWSYEESWYGGGNWSYTNILIGAQGNYHFKSTGKFDAWTGVVLAYDAGSVDWDGPSGSYNEPSHGGLWLGAHAGARYFFSPSLAISGRIGFGTLSYGAIDIGVDFTL